MLITLAVSGYRSLRNISLPLERLNVITGPNGSGKSSLYRAIQLLVSASQGSVTNALAIEGGLSSTLWAGPERISSAVKRGDYPLQGTVRKDPISLRLGFASDDFGYAIDLGLPAPGRSLFNRDPACNPNRSACRRLGYQRKPNHAGVKSSSVRQYDNPCCKSKRSP